ncbi:MAG: hypothetical protein ACKPKO_51940 [Candidatus Fonsibacter sp.]
MCFVTDHLPSILIVLSCMLMSLSLCCSYRARQSYT